MKNLQHKEKGSILILGTVLMVLMIFMAGIFLSMTVQSYSQMDKSTARTKLEWIAAAGYNIMKADVYKYWFDKEKFWQILEEKIDGIDFESTKAMCRVSAVPVPGLGIRDILIVSKAMSCSRADYEANIDNPLFKPDTYTLMSRLSLSAPTDYAMFFDGDGMVHTIVSNKEVDPYFLGPIHCNGSLGIGFLFRISGVPYNKRYFVKSKNLLGPVISVSNIFWFLKGDWEGIYGAEADINIMDAQNSTVTKVAAFPNFFQIVMPECMPYKYINASNPHPIVPEKPQPRIFAGNKGYSNMNQFNVEQVDGNTRSLYRDKYSGGYKIKIPRQEKLLDFYRNFKDKDGKYCFYTPDDASGYGDSTARRFSFYDESCALKQPLNGTSTTNLENEAIGFCNKNKDFFCSASGGKEFNGAKAGDVKVGGIIMPPEGTFTLPNIVFHPTAATPNVIDLSVGGTRLTKNTDYDLMYSMYSNKNLIIIHNPDHSNLPTGKPGGLAMANKLKHLYASSNKSSPDGDFTNYRSEAIISPLNYVATPSGKSIEIKMISGTPSARPIGLNNLSSCNYLAFSFMDMSTLKAHYRNNYKYTYIGPGMGNWGRDNDTASPRYYRGGGNSFGSSYHEDAAGIQIAEGATRFPGDVNAEYPYYESGYIQGSTFSDEERFYYHEASGRMMLSRPVKVYNKPLLNTDGTTMTQIGGTGWLPGRPALIYELSSTATTNSENIRAFCKAKVELVTRSFEYTSSKTVTTVTMTEARDVGQALGSTTISTSTKFYYDFIRVNNSQDVGAYAYAYADQIKLFENVGHTFPKREYDTVNPKLITKDVAIEVSYTSYAPEVVTVEGTVKDPSQIGFQVCTDRVVDAIVLDLSKIQDDDSFPSEGVVYAECPLVVVGIPKRPITIYSKENIYAGNINYDYYDNSGSLVKSPYPLDSPNASSVALMSSKNVLIMYAINQIDSSISRQLPRINYTHAYNVSDLDPINSVTLNKVIINSMSNNLINTHTRPNSGGHFSNLRFIGSGVFGTYTGLDEPGTKGIKDMYHTARYCNSRPAKYGEDYGVVPWHSQVESNNNPVQPDIVYSASFRTQLPPHIPLYLENLSKEQLSIEYLETDSGGEEQVDRAENFFKKIKEDILSKNWDLVEEADYEPITRELLGVDE